MSPAWHPWLLIAAGGAAIILTGIILQIAQLVVSIRRREELRDETGDPWNGRSLEWATPSPPPAFNFAVLPNVEGEDAYWGMKQRARQQARLGEEPALYGHRDAEEQPNRLHLRLLRHLHGIRADLAHLVDGRRWPHWAPTRPSSSSPGATGTSTSFRRKRSRASIGPTEAHAARRSPDVQAAP